MAAVDCSSRVLYLPFMARLKSTYLTSFFIGEGLSGFIPSILALIQGVGGNPECIVNEFGNSTAVIPDPVFSVDTFLYIMAAFSMASFIAFVLLNHPGLVSKSLAEPVSSVNKSLRNKNGEERLEPFYQSTLWSEEEAGVSFLNRGDQNNQSSRRRRPITQVEPVIESNRSAGELCYLLVLQTVICGLSNGVFPAIQSYSCLPYGNETYHWTVTLSSMANPAVCFLMFCLPKAGKLAVTLSALAGVAISSYVMQTAVLSPNPPLVGTTEGEVILVSFFSN